MISPTLPKVTLAMLVQAGSHVAQLKNVASFHESPIELAPCLRCKASNVSNPTLAKATAAAALITSDWLGDLNNTILLPDSR